MVEWFGTRAGTRQVMPDAKPGNEEWVIEITYDTGEIRRWFTDDPKVRVFTLWEWRLGKIDRIDIFRGNSEFARTVLK